MRDVIRRMSGKTSHRDLTRSETQGTNDSKPRSRGGMFSAKETVLTKAGTPEVVGGKVGLFVTPVKVIQGIQSITKAAFVVSEVPIFCTNKSEI